MATAHRSKPPATRKSRIRVRAAEMAKPRGRAGGDAVTRRPGTGREAELERACRSLGEELERVERTSAELVSTLAHDLRNPLSVILVSAKLLARSLGAEHASNRHVDAVGRAADEINQMLQDVSDASNIERGRLALVCEPKALAPLADRALAAVELAATSKGLSLEKRVAADLPDVLVEPERLVKVLQHLLLNAIKFTPRGGKVTLELDDAGDSVRVVIADTGPGIAVESRALAFSRTGNGKKPHPQGVGLGLFVTRGIVEAHGGEVWMDSELGQGSRFGFSLPKAKAEAPTNAAAG
jgi:signal transduction histidine kinase